jgi:hypothetical protein
MKLFDLLTEEKKEGPNSNDFRDMYKKLGINQDKLGCIMLNIDKDAIPELPEEFKDLLYTSKNKERFWIKGFVGGDEPHCTLLYGLMESGKKNKKYVDKVLGDWKPDAIKVASIGFFDSPYKDDPYYCIVAHLEVTDNLLEGRSRLELLPHINTFPGYKAHVTIAYIEKNDDAKKKIIKHYKDTLVGKKLKVDGLNYGK